MMRVASSFVLLSSVSATSSLSASSLTSGKQEALQQKVLNYGKGMRDFADRGILPAATTTEASASSSKLNSAAAVAGDWITATTGAGDSCSTSFALSEGYLMGFCSENMHNTTTASTFSKYTCTQNDATNQIVLSETTYTDSACTAGASVQADVTLSTICDDGFTPKCGANSYTQTSAYVVVTGLLASGYGTIGECTSGLEADLVTYQGLQGCQGDGTSFGMDSASFYENFDCTGTAGIVASYSNIFSPGCNSNEEDDGDDDDGSGFAYDNAFYTLSWFDYDPSDDVCFHVDSKIDYKGVEYTYEELKAGKEPECTVPHSPSSKGVVISTSCDKTVRVTDTHLMATTKGFQLAYSLKPGDVLFGDYDKEMCVVTSVEKEKTAQQYFGLNCVHSEVLASGLRASTFGDFHTLPSWYMTYVGSMIGSETASSLGEYIAEWYFQKK